MPKGGRRAGAGRKPGAAWAGRGRSVVLGMDGQRKAPRRSEELPPAVSGEVKEGLLAAPYWLSEGAKGCWERWAGEAIAERTLTPATAAGFTLMCQRADYVAKLGVRIDTLGADTQDAVPYLNIYSNMSQKLETSLARFKLTAFGKPATSDKPKAAANPWGEVAAK